MSEPVTQAMVPARSMRLEFDDRQEKMIRDMYLGGAPKEEAEVLLEIARARGLSPLLGQIHFVERWDSAKDRKVWAAQTGIDGFRLIAERTGFYDGQDDAEFDYRTPTDEPDQSRAPLNLRAITRVYRRDVSRAYVGTARFREFAQKKRNGELTFMWATKPFLMLAKCSEAMAFRRAFPTDTSGLFAPEEIGDGERPGVAAFIKAPDAVGDAKQRTLAEATAVMVARIEEFRIRLAAAVTAGPLALRAWRAAVEGEPEAVAIKAALRDEYNRAMEHAK